MEGNTVVAIVSQQRPWLESRSGVRRLHVRLFCVVALCGREWPLSGWGMRMSDDRRGARAPNGFVVGLSQHSSGQSDCLGAHTGLLSGCWMTRVCSGG